MPTAYTDQFWVLDPFAPPPVGTTLTVVSFEIIDQNDNNLINQFSGDSVDGVDIVASYPGDTVSVDLSGGGSITVTGTTFYLADGREVFTPTDGTVLETATFTGSSFVTTQGPLEVGDLGPPCFTSGTLIETPTGQKSVENLREGDTVSGYEGEELILRKVLRRVISARDLAINPKLRPICIMAGALGQNLPERDLLVSRQHRMLVKSKIVERMFGQEEVLLPAVKLLELPGIFVTEDVTRVEYIHLLFDRHEVIRAEGAPTESLFTGPEALKAMSPDAREEILTLFPEVAELNYEPEPARHIPPQRLQKQLIKRHAKNNQPVLNSK